MILWLALLAAFSAALCSAAATVLQKISADRSVKAVSLRVGLFFRLLRDWPYLTGILLDMVSYGLQLVAVHSLPLFVVLPIVALSVVIVAMIEHIALRQKLRRQTVMAISCIVIGLVLLALTATPETATVAGHSVRLAVMLAPVLLAGLGIICAKIQSQLTTTLLAVGSGLAFGGTSIIGRMVRIAPPYWHVVISPLFAALLAYGLIGMLMFTVALQRQRASIVNAVMITFFTIVPIAVGLLLLGDRPRHGWWLVMIVGAGLALTGTVLVAATDPAVEA
jgi:drug/metabolite transporter (DMT)-like permease